MKLTDDACRRIVADPSMQIEIAARYGITPTYVCMLKAAGGRPPRSSVKITRAKAAAIIADPRSLAAIAADYGISKSYVSQIKNRVCTPRYDEPTRTLPVRHYRPFETDLGKEHHHG